jgi:hypothetical protein
MSGIKFSIVAANNHYDGFGPGTVNIFRQLLGLDELKWGDNFTATEGLEKNDDVYADIQGIKTKQTNLSDYL